MKPHVGLWDALFGKTVTIEVPMPTGGVKKVQVTQKWVEQMQGSGQMKNVTSEMVKVNVLDPMHGLSLSNFDDPSEFLDALGDLRSDVQVEHWRIGERVTQEQHDNFLDPETQELYALTAYEDGKARTMLVQRSLWEEIREKMRSV